MGEVYQATDAKLGRSVAIKLVPEAFAHDTERAARFQREARVQASLNHPNIAAIPGTTYAFQVRSLSKAGFSNWTDLTARFSPRMDNTHT